MNQTIYPTAPAVEDILLSLHVGSTAHDVHDAVEKIHALRYPTGCPGGGCERCVARLARYKNPNAVALGRLGGLRRGASQKQAEASRTNGKKGGRPKGKRA